MTDLDSRPKRNNVVKLRGGRATPPPPPGSVGPRETYHQLIFTPDGKTDDRDLYRLMAQCEVGGGTYEHIVTGGRIEKPLDRGYTLIIRPQEGGPAQRFIRRSGNDGNITKSWDEWNAQGKRDLEELVVSEKQENTKLQRRFSVAVGSAVVAGLVAIGSIVYGATQYVRTQTAQEALAAFEGRTIQAEQRLTQRELELIQRYGDLRQRNDANENHVVAALQVSQGALLEAQEAEQMATRAYERAEKASDRMLDTLVLHEATQPLRDEGESLLYELKSDLEAANEVPAMVRKARANAKWHPRYWSQIRRSVGKTLAKSGQGVKSVLGVEKRISRTAYSMARDSLRASLDLERPDAYDVRDQTISLLGLRIRNGKPAESKDAVVYQAMIGVRADSLPQALGILHDELGVGSKPGRRETFVGLNTPLGDSRSVVEACNMYWFAPKVNAELATTYCPQ